MQRLRAGSKFFCYKLCTAPSGLPMVEDRPSCVVLNTLHSYMGDGLCIVQLIAHSTDIRLRHKTQSTSYIEEAVEGVFITGSGGS